MIKGCKKNVVWVRDTGNDMFDEAYFILSDKGKMTCATEGDMIKVASRLVADSPVASYFESENNARNVKKPKQLWKAVWFMLGASFMTVLNVLVVLIL